MNTPKVSVDDDKYHRLSDHHPLSAQTNIPCPKHRTKKPPKIDKLADLNLQDKNKIIDYQEEIEEKTAQLVQDNLPPAERLHQLCLLSVAAVKSTTHEKRKWDGWSPHYMLLRRKLIVLRTINRRVNGLRKSYK